MPKKNHTIPQDILDKARAVLEKTELIQRSNLRMISSPQLAMLLSKLGYPITAIKTRRAILQEQVPVIKLGQTLYVDAFLALDALSKHAYKQGHLLNLQHGRHQAQLRAKKNRQEVSSLAA